MSKKQENSCSFCGRPESQVNLLISGMNGFICDECVGRAHQMLTEEMAHRSRAMIPDFKLLKPLEIKQFLSSIIFNINSINPFEFPALFEFSIDL